MAFRRSSFQFRKSMLIGLALAFGMAPLVGAADAAPQPSPTPAAPLQPNESAATATASPNTPAPTPPPREDATIYDAYAPSRLRGSVDVVVLQSSDIKALPAHNVADLLKLVAGVEVSPNTPLFNNSQVVSIRGSSAGQVLILLDGRRLNDGMNGEYDLSMLGLDQIERIEIMRNGGSAIYGESAAGGVIYISTHKTKDGFRLRAENTSYLPVLNTWSILAYLLGGTIDLSALVSGQTGGVSGSFSLGKSRLTINGSGLRDAGLFPYIDSGGGNQVWKQVISYGANVGIGFDTPIGDTGSFWVKLDGLARRQAFPATILGTSPSNYYDNTQVGGSVGWDLKNFISPDLGFKGQVWGSYNQEVPANSSLSSYGNYGIELQQSARLSEMYSLDYGLSFKQELVNSNYYIQTDSVMVMREDFGVFVRPVLQTGGLMMAPTVRLDFFDSLPAAFGVGLDTSLAITPEIGIWLNLSRNYRMPSLTDQNNTLSGNPSLKPETVYASELGLVIQTQGFTSRSSGFFRYVQNRIALFYGSLPFYPYYYITQVNLYDALYPGFDQDFSLNLGWINAGINYEFMHSYIVGGGIATINEKRTAMTPDHRLKARLGFRFGGIEIGTDGELVSQAFWDEANTQIKPAYFLWNAHVTFWMGDVSNLYIAVDNLLNASYRLSYNVPMPGFTVRIGLNLGL